MWRQFSGLLGAEGPRRSSNHESITNALVKGEKSLHPLRNTALTALTAAGIMAILAMRLSAQPVNLGQAQNFAVLGTSTVTNAGASTVIGNVGLSPGPSITGFPPGTILNGALHINDALAGQGHADASLAYAALVGASPTQNLSGTDLGGQTLLPGVYRFDSSAALTGTLLLDTRKDPNGTYIFQIGSSLGVGAGSAVTLLGPGGSDPNIFWQVGSTAAIAANANFAGNILASASVTLAAGANLVVGRALAINGAVTLSDNIVNSSGALLTGNFWNGAVSNHWSNANWSPDATGATSSNLVSGQDVIFSVTGSPAAQNQNTDLDLDVTISSLNVDDSNAVTITGAHTISINGTGLGRGIVVNSGAGLVTINSDLQLSGFSQGVTVNNAAGLVVNGNVGGAIGLTKVGTGQLTLTASETYTGGTLIIGGTLQLGDGITAGSSIASSGQVTIDSGATLALNLSSGETFGNATTNNGLVATIASGTNTLSGNISGTGALLQSGSSLTALTGTNTYSGGTTISGGTLDLGAGGTTGSITGNVIDNANLVVDRSNAINLDGNISGNGNLTQAAAGTLTLSGLNTYTGFTLASNGTLLAGSTTGLSPASAFTVNINAILDLNGFSNTVGSLAGGGTVTNGGVTAAILTAGGDGSTSTFSGVLQNGISPSLGLAKAGSGSLILTGENTYTGGTSITGGFLQIGNGSTGGSIVGNVAAAAGTALVFKKSSDLSFAGTISGAGGLVQGGSGTVTLTGDNSYTGVTAIDSGAVQVGGGGTTGAIAGDVLDLGSLIFDRSDSVTYGGVVSGTGSLSKEGSGALALTGASTYTGATTVSAGTLQVNGSLANTALAVQSGATLAGTGTIAGGVTIQDGGHLGVATVAQTLSVGSLTLSSGSILDYRLSTPGAGGGVNTLVNAENLTLDGTLNVTNGGNFGSGAYRLFNYTGVLTDLTLALGTLPAGFSYAVTTGVAHQVNLVVSSGSAPVQFWDGSTTTFDPSLHGGTGTWDNFTTNFTDNVAAPNQSWQNGVAIFSAQPGIVTLGDDIFFQGLQFQSDGYNIIGAGTFALHPTGIAVVSIDPGVIATIAAPIVGAGGLNKAGTGELVLSGLNTYSGDTTISGGVLSVGSDTNLGNPGGVLALNGGELLTTVTGFNSARAITLTPNGSLANILGAALNTTATYSGLISGTGGLTIGNGAEAGTVVLTNLNNTYTGGTTVSAAAVLSVADDRSLGASTGGLTLDGGELVATGNAFQTFRPILLTANNGTLAAGANGPDFEGDITGPGALTVGDAINTGIVGLGGTNSYLGSTTVVAAVTLKAFSSGALSPSSAFTVTGTLDLNGFNNEIGSLAGTGAVTNSSSTAAILSAGNDGSSTTFSGLIQDGSGQVALTKLGTGALTLSGNNTYSGATIVSSGTLLAGSTTALSTTSAFTVDATLDLNGFSSQIGSLAGASTGTVTNNGSAAAGLTTGGDNTSTTFSGVIQNGTMAVSLAKIGSGTLILTGENTFQGGTVITAGSLQLGNGGAGGSIGGDVINNAAFVVDQSDTLVFNGAISGSGTLSQVGTGILNLTGTSTYTGATTVSAGTLKVNGVLGNTAVTVQSGATLSGQGTVAGSVAILNGGHLAPGDTLGTLSVGPLLLNSGSILDYQLSTPGVIGSGVNDLVNVTGALTLDGVLNVTNGGNFGSGAYRLINFTGALTNNLLALGTLPSGFRFEQRGGKQRRRRAG